MYSGRASELKRVPGIVKRNLLVSQKGHLRLREEQWFIQSLDKWVLRTLTWPQFWLVWDWWFQHGNPVAAIGLSPLSFLDWIRAALPRGGSGEGRGGWSRTPGISYVFTCTCSLLQSCPVEYSVWNFKILWINGKSPPVLWKYFGFVRLPIHLGEHSFAFYPLAAALLPEC